MMDAKKLSDELCRHTERVVRYLLPAGRKVGQEWQVGSIHGEKGSSLNIHLSGHKAGVWSDFATGEKGDLLDLWCSVRGVSFKNALTETQDFLGIRELTPDFGGVRKYSKPEKPRNLRSIGSSVMEYLSNNRKLSEKTLSEFKIGQDSGEIVFPYFRDDELIHWKKLSLNRGSDGKKKMSTSKASEPCLFGWQALDDNARQIVICEGEIDAMSLHQYGWNALSVPYGAGSGDKQKWVEYEYDNLQRFEDIYICMDNDEPGNKTALELAKRLGLHRCKIVLLPCKDANECLQEGLRKEDLLPHFESARPPSHPMLRSPDEFLEQVIEMFYPSPEKQAEGLLPWSKSQPNIRLRESELSLWMGYNHHGKSMLLSNVMLHLMDKGERVCVASLEMSAKAQLQRLYRQATTNAAPSIPYIREAQSYLTEKLWLYDLVGSVKIEELLEAFSYAHNRYGCKYFIIDSLMKLGKAEDDYAGQKELIDILCDFKMVNKIHIALVTHATKGNEYEVPNRFNIKGSGGISDLADTVMCVWRNIKKKDALEAGSEITDVDSMPDAVLKCDKQRNGEWIGKIPLWFDARSLQYIESSSSRPKRYVSYSEVRAINREDG